MKVVEFENLKKTCELVIVVILFSVAVILITEFVASVPVEYSYTRIVCTEPEDNQSYCQDAVVSCRGGKVVNIKLLGNPIRMNYIESPLGWCEK
jgi:hypothetical protein